MANNKKDAYVNSLVGKGTRFDGVLNLSGLLRIDGDLTGSINTDGRILIGRTGRVKCSISAGSLIIGGAVKGNIRSFGKVVVLSTGMVLGSIKAPLLVVEEGAILHGKNYIMTDFRHRHTPLPDVEYQPDWGQAETSDSASDNDRIEHEFLSWRK